MKKLFILLFVLFAFTAKSQFLKTAKSEFSKLKPLSSFELGTKSRELHFYEHGLVFSNAYKYDYPSFYADLYIGVQYYNFYLTSNVISNFSKTDLKNHTFSPFLAEYYLDFFYSHKRIKIGYQHFCSHPVISNQNRDDVINTYINDYHDKFYIKFDIIK